MPICHYVWSRKLCLFMKHCLQPNDIQESFSTVLPFTYTGWRIRPPLHIGGLPFCRYESWISPEGSILLEHRLQSQWAAQLYTEYRFSFEFQNLKSGVWHEHFQCAKQRTQSKTSTDSTQFSDPWQMLPLRSFRIDEKCDWIRTVIGNCFSLYVFIWFVRVVVFSRGDRRLQSAGITYQNTQFDNFTFYFNRIYCLLQESIHCSSQRAGKIEELSSYQYQYHQWRWGSHFAIFALLLLMCSCALTVPCAVPLTVPCTVPLTVSLIEVRQSMTTIMHRRVIEANRNKKRKRKRFRSRTASGEFLIWICIRSYWRTLIGA